MTNHTDEDAVLEAIDPLSGNAETDLNHARVSGPDSPAWRALLARRMTFLLPKNRERDARQTDWKNSGSISLRAWLEGGPDGALTHHVERGAKGYFPVVFGGAAKPKGYTSRTADGMKTVECIGLDVDSGDSYSAVLDRVEALGVACIAYTSYSDGTRTSRLKRDDVLRHLKIDRDPTEDEMRAFLAAKGGLRPEIVASVRIEAQAEHTEKGVQIVLSHAPLEKWRLLFPLVEPLTVTTLAPASHRKAREVYARKVRGLAQMLGVMADEACFDVSRVFYLPSHPPGGDYALDVIRGRGLTVAEIPEVEKGGSKSAFEIAGGAEAGPEIAGMSAKAWAKKYGQRLLIAELIRGEAPEKEREDKGGLLVVECPFDEWHGNADDPDDSACHVRDADVGEGFVWQCKHNSCAGHDRLDMLQKALADGWFDASCLVSDDYLVPLSDEELEAENASAADGRRKGRKPKAATGDDYADAEPESYETDEVRFEPARDWLPKAYRISGGTIWGPGKDDDEIPLCQAFDVIGRASNVAGDAGAGRIICFTNENGSEVETTLSMADLIREGGGGVLEKLADAGMTLFISRKSREPILNLFRQIHPQRHVPTVPRAGWVRDRGGLIVGFMCPTGEYIEAEAGHPFRLATTATVRDRASGGTLKGWREAVDAAFENDPKSGAPNFFWVLGAAGGFAGPLMLLAGVTGCGLNFSGEAARGKTTALLLGSTVWATPYPTKGVFFPANSTANAVEVIAATASESFGAFDDLAAMQRPQDLSAVLYGVSGGSGKSRMAGISAAAGLGEAAEFRTFMLLSSEHTLKDTITGAGVEYRAGLSRRYPDVNVTAGARVSGEVLGRIEGVQRNYGHAGPAFVRWLIAEGWHTKGHELRKRIGEAADALAGDDAIPAQREAAKVFALVQVAGELAVDAGILSSKAKIEVAVLTAWQTFGASDEGRATEGEASLLNGFRSWLAGAQGVYLTDASDPDARLYRERLGWVTETQIVLINDKINMKAMGLSGTRDGLVKALQDAGALVMSGGNRRHTNLPSECGGGRVTNLRIDRDKLGMPPPSSGGNPVVGE